VKKKEREENVSIFYHRTVVNSWWLSPFCQFFFFFFNFNFNLSSVSIDKYIFHNWRARDICSTSATGHKGTSALGPGLPPSLPLSPLSSVSARQQPFRQYLYTTAHQTHSIRNYLWISSQTSISLASLFYIHNIYYIQHIHTLLLFFIIMMILDPPGTSRSSASL